MIWEPTVWIFIKSFLKVENTFTISIPFTCLTSSHQTGKISIYIDFLPNDQLPSPNASGPNLHSGSRGRIIQFSCSVVFDSLRLHGLQHTRRPCPSPTPRVYKLMSIELVMPSNHLILCRPLLLVQSFPASGSFPMSQFFASGGQSIGSFSFSNQSFQ